MDIKISKLNDIEFFERVEQMERKEWTVDDVRGFLHDDIIAKVFISNMHFITSIRCNGIATIKYIPGLYRSQLATLSQLYLLQWLNGLRSLVFI